MERQSTTDTTLYWRDFCMKTTSTPITSLHTYMYYVLDPYAKGKVK